MLTGSRDKEPSQQPILTKEQDELLDLYILKLDDFFEDIKKTEKIQVEIETLHLKKMLSK